MEWHGGIIIHSNQKYTVLHRKTYNNNYITDKHMQKSHSYAYYFYNRQNTDYVIEHGITLQSKMTKQMHQLERICMNHKSNQQTCKNAIDFKVYKHDHKVFTMFLLRSQINLHPFTFHATFMKSVDTARGGVGGCL